MCGLVVVVAAAGRFDAESFGGAVTSLSHRGPDGGGMLRVGRCEHLEAWLGHRRLSIVDLSTAGQQPMVRPGRGAIVFNGEVFDHVAQRRRLADRWDFTSRSDTEVLLAGLLEEGPDFLRSANAMMAAVSWDERTNELTVARDRLGKKPLFVYSAHGVLAFASELKAFRALGLPLTPDPTSLAYYRWLNHVPGPRTSYLECTKFPAGSWARIDLSARTPALGVPRLFWDPFAAMGRHGPARMEDAVEQLGALLDDATQRRLEADAPVGVFLSGGIDSALVAASAARQQTSPLTTFVVQADDPELDESRQAAETAARLGLSHRTLLLPRDAHGAQLERVPFHFDDLCAPLSQLALMALSEAARAHVKVVLTGDGGDEVFLGYPWFGHSRRLWALAAPTRAFPQLRSFADSMLDTGAGRLTFGAAARALRLQNASLDGKLAVARRALGAGHASEIHEEFLAITPRHQLSQDDRARLGDESLLDRARTWYPGYSWDALNDRSVPEALAALDLVLDMRDHILVKVDRATMAHGLEARSPLLDHRIVEFGFSLPLDLKLRGGQTKRILRHLCASRVGAAVASRRKQGFGIPLPAQVAAPGGSAMVRWNRHVEQAWRTTWLGHED